MSRGLGATIGDFLKDQRNAFRRLFGRAPIGEERDWQRSYELALEREQALIAQVDRMTQDNLALQAELEDRRRRRSADNDLAQFYTLNAFPNRANDWARSEQAARLNAEHYLNAQQQLAQQQNLIESALYAPSLYPGVATANVATNPNPPPRQSSRRNIRRH